MPSAPASPGAWPNPERPGEPLNPDKDGAHWVHWFCDQYAMPAWWFAAERHWLWPGERDPMGAGWVGPQARYLGRCLMDVATDPQGIAAQLEGKGQLSLAGAVKRLGDDNERLQHAVSTHAATVAAAAAGARREALEEAAAIAEGLGAVCCDACEEPLVAGSGAHVAAAIRARVGE